jgi:PPOX class probable F420-dependent enzyme
MNEREREFLEQHHAAAMVTLRPDGTPHVVRVGVAVVDGKLWSSGIPGRVRTKHLRRDPRAALFVFDPTGANPFPWLGVEGTVTILDGPDAAEKSVRLFRAMQAGLPRQPAPGHLLWEGEEKTETEFLRIMEEQQRLIYEFEITRTYGPFDQAWVRG